MLYSSQGCGKSFCRKTTLTKHTRRNHADAEGTYTGIGGPATIMSNSISMARCTLPPHSRSTFPHGLEHHYLASLKVEGDHVAISGPGAGQLQQPVDYPGTPYSAPPMSSCPSSSTSYDGFDLARRPSVISAGYLSSSTHMFHSPTGNGTRICPTSNTLTPASELSQFPRTPEVRDANAFETSVSAARPHFNHLSIGNMACGPCGPEQHTSTAGFQSSVLAPSQPFSMMSGSCVMAGQDASNIDPNLWDSGVSAVDSHFYNSYQQPRQAFQQQQAVGTAFFHQQPASSERFNPYFLRSAAHHQVCSS